jgi:hypothetical protein
VKGSKSRNQSQKIRRFKKMSRKARGEERRAKAKNYRTY